MRHIQLVLSLCTQYVLSELVYGFPNYRIPIGALFDQDSVQAHTAFRYEIEKHNNSSSSLFKLNKYEKIFDVSNSYELSKAVCSTMFKGIFALFGVVNKTSVTTAASFGRTFHMPYITPSSITNDTGASTEFSLNMRPTYDKVIIDIIKHYRWPRIFYIYDTDQGLARMQQLHNEVHTNDLKVDVDVLRIRDVENCYALLRHLDSMGPLGEKYIILDLSTEKAMQSVLRQIQNVGMNRANYHYVLGGLVMDELDLRDFKHGGVNITGFRLVDPESPMVREVQRKWSKLDSEYWKGAGNNSKIKLDAALTMDAVRVVVQGLDAMMHRDPDVFRNVFRRGQVYNSNGSRGIQCQSEPIPWVHGPAIMTSFKNVKFEGVSGRVAFDSHGYRQNYKLDVLELSLDSETKKVGTWDSKSGLVSTPQPPKKKDEEGGNKTRIVTTILSAPYLMVRKQPDDDGKPLVLNDRYEGFCADLAKKISDVVGFDYVLKLVEDGTYGAKQDDGTWSGMVGELTNREADLAIAPLTISSMRERVIDFSKPFMSLGISIMIKKPEKQKPGVFSFMEPLSKEIWLCIVFSYLGVSAVLFLVSRFSPYEWQIEDSVNGPTFTNDFTILNSLWFSLGAFMQQGCDISPRSMSGRIVGSAWWFFTLIIISSYTANLAAFLTVERMLTPIESADDLAKQTEIQYGTLDAGSTKDFFRSSNIAVYERMWAFMQSAEPSVFVTTTLEGVSRVRNSKGKYAFLLESTMNNYHNQRKPCNTMNVGDNLDSKGYGIATPLGSDLRERISLAVLKLREGGELQKLHKKWWYDKGECASESDGKGITPNHNNGPSIWTSIVDATLLNDPKIIKIGQEGSSQSALTLSNVAGIFYILIGGLGLSMVVSLLEFLYKSRLESRRQKNYASSIRSKTRLSIRSTPERENGGYSYSAPSQVVSLDGGYTDMPNTQTQV